MPVIPTLRRNLRPVFIILLAVLVFGALWLATLRIEETQGTSLAVGGEFVMLEDGFRGDRITWLVVRNWPAGTQPEEIANDPRFDIRALPRRVLMADGKQTAVASTPHIYFFDGRKLTTFPVRMVAGDITDLHGHLRELKNYRELLPLLRRYQVAQE